MFVKISLAACLSIAVSTTMSSTVSAADGALEDICKVRASAYDKVFMEGKAAEMASLYLPDAVENGPYGIVEGPKAIADAYGAFVKPGVKHTHNVKGGRMLGNVAMCWGEWTFTPPDGSKGLAGRYTAIYAKNESGWRIEGLTYNFLPAPAPAKTQ